MDIGNSEPLDLGRRPARRAGFGPRHGKPALPERGSAVGRWASKAALALVAACCGLQPAQAGWREDIGTFRIGMVAEPGAGNTIAGLGELTEAYTMALGLKVEFFVARDFADLIDAQTTMQVEYAVYSATAYAAAFERCGCIEPLAAPVGDDGSIGIRSVLITRDGALSSLADMEKRRVAISPPDSVAGYQMPFSVLPLTGAEAFLVDAQSAQAAESMLVEGKVDAVFGWMPAAPPGAPDLVGGTMARLEAAGLDRSAMAIVWQSDVLRYGPHAVLKSLDPEPKRRLAMFLTGLRQADPALYERLESHHLGGFVAASQADYGLALEVVRRVAKPVAE